MKAINRNKYFFGLIFLLPAFWWFVLNLNPIFHEWLKTPGYLTNTVAQIIQVSDIEIWHIVDLKWETENYPRNHLATKLFYNKSSLAFNELFNYLNLLSPKLYFQGGDQDNLSSLKVEFIPAIFLPVWILGIFYLVKLKKWKIFIAWCTIAFFCYLIGQKNLAFLFPLVILNTYFIYQGLNFINLSGYKKLFIYLGIIYCLFLISRMIWSMF